MSQFGADIFDDEPPTKPPARKGRKSSPPTASEPASTDSEAAPAAPRKRASRRKKPEAPDAPADNVAQSQPAAADATPSRADAAPVTPADEAQVVETVQARPDRPTRGRGRRRNTSPEDFPAANPGSAEELPPPSREPAAQRAVPAAPSESDYDEEGEGFGALPGEDAQPADGEGNDGAEAPRDDGNFPRFGDERRGRRRRRRRGRRGHRDDAQRGQGGHEAPHGDTPFTRDAHAEPGRPQGDRGGFPRDPAGPQLDRRDDRRGRQEPSRHHDHDAEEDRQPRAPRRPHSDFKPAPPPPQLPEPRRIAVLLDLANLTQQAREQGGEIAYRKLRSAIAGHDEVVHAVCFTTRELPEAARRVLTGQGFTIEDCADADACADALLDQASRAQWPVDALVVVGSRARASLPAAAGGAGVETAGFDGKGSSGNSDRQLPRSCLFVP